MKAASEYFMPDNKDPMQALQVITQAVMDLAAQKNQKQAVDFRNPGKHRDDTLTLIQKTKKTN